jgi:ATP-dependent Lon protease
MRESVPVALSFVPVSAEALEIDLEDFDRYDLHGPVPVGGIEEKIERDLLEIPSAPTENSEFRFVRNVSEVLNIALPSVDGGERGNS